VPWITKNLQTLDGVSPAAKRVGHVRETIVVEPSGEKDSDDERERGGQPARKLMHPERVHTPADRPDRRADDREPGRCNLDRVAVVRSRDRHSR
jgi:hypothetical protein